MLAMKDASQYRACKDFGVQKGESGARVLLSERIHGFHFILCPLDALADRFSHLNLFGFGLGDFFRSLLVSW